MSAASSTECIECGDEVPFKDLYHPYNAGKITACIPCWREALAAGGWPGDLKDERRDEDGSED